MCLEVKPYYTIIKVRIIYYYTIDNILSLIFRIPCSQICIWIGIFQRNFYWNLSFKSHRNTLSDAGIYELPNFFLRWRFNKLHLDFSRRHEEIGCNLLQAVPIFGAALLQVSRYFHQKLACSEKIFHVAPRFILRNHVTLL